MATTEHILLTAARQLQLVKSIQELDNAPTALSQQTSHLTDLRSQLASIEKRLAKLTQKTESQRKEHESLRDSTTRRIAFKLVGQKGKFESKAEKEER
jgi:uncharacterized membrane protein